MNRRLLNVVLLCEAFDRGEITERCLSHLLAMHVLDRVELDGLRFS